MTGAAQVRRNDRISQKSDFVLTIERRRTDDSPEVSCPDGSARLERLIRGHRALIRRLCSTYAWSREDLEDLEALTVLAVCRRFDTFDPDRGTFGTWVGTILKHEAADMRRKMARQPVCVPNDAHTEFLLASAAAPFEDPIPDGPVEEGFLLTPVLRQAFDLVKLQGLSYAEAALLMGRPEGTIRTYVWKARQAMKTGNALGA